MKIVLRNKKQNKSILEKFKQDNDVKFHFQNKLFIVLMLINVIVLFTLCIILYTLVSAKGDASKQKIINDISVINNDKKYISEREFKNRFPAAYKSWLTTLKDIDDENHSVDGSLYVIYNDEIMIYFNNGYESTYSLKFDSASNNWYETAP